MFVWKLDTKRVITGKKSKHDPHLYKTNEDKDKSNIVFDAETLADTKKFRYVFFPIVNGIQCYEGCH
jgi:hypothetical protein